MFDKRTDLALESRMFYRQQQGREPDGVDIEEYTQGEAQVTKIIIRDEQGAASVGKPMGTYITVTLKSDWLQSPEWIGKAAELLAGLLKGLLPEEGAILVAGLGNRGITPDNLGPSAIDNIIVTRHLIDQMPLELGGMRPVCAISTGVLGLTGIETAEIVKGISQRVGPAAIIAIDALAAGDPERLYRTFQLSDTGISPGSGASNSRHTLNQQELGVPVIAIGVPTVIDSATLVAFALEKMGIDTAVYTATTEDSMLVTPKDIDALIGKSAKVIGYCVNMALQKGMTVAEMEQFLC